MSKRTISAYEFLKLFPDDQAARLHIERLRWPDGVTCPHCRAIEGVRAQTRKGVPGYYHCPGCGEVFTVRTGTLFERSHIPLDKWLYAMYLVATSRKGISSMKLSKELGLTQKTAWFLLQRLREACGHDKDDQNKMGGPGLPGKLLSGVVETPGQLRSMPTLLALAEKHCWWKEPNEALEYPQRVVAAVMDKGTLQDTQSLLTLLGADALREALEFAEAGQFRPKSWAYWHYRLNGLCEHSLPSMPIRTFR